MTDSQIQMEKMTWREVESRLASPNAVVIVPIASTEQHGPHLPLSTDTIIGEELSCRIAHQLDSALVAPAVRPGVSPFHRDFTGSLSIPAECLMSLLRHLVFSLEQHGATHIVLLPSHGGNFPSVNTLAPELAQELESANLHTLADLERCMELMNEGLQKAGIEYEESVVHAGATETAIMLAAAPSLVREDEIEPGYEGDISMGGLLEEGFQQYTASGVLGDPTHATAAAGEKILEAMTNAYVAQLNEEFAELSKS